VPDQPSRPSSPPELRPAEPMYQVLSRHLAAEITADDSPYPSGTLLPSETELIKTFGVSRSTVRQAIGQLRAMGLVESHQGKGTVVRGKTTLGAPIQRTLVRRGKRFAPGDNLSAAEEPVVSRAHATGTIADLLGRGPAHVMLVDQLLTNPDTGARVAHRLVIPFDVADQVPDLADEPGQRTPTEVYGMLADAGHSLTFWETVTARVARPDERATLALRDSDSILITYRVTTDAAGTALLVEETRASALASSLTYRITPTTPQRARV
jgi:GntR family transcriptional regulator